jgi:WD40 repeat protein/serine/threonine protein kinase
MTTENNRPSDLESEIIASLGQLPKGVLEGLKQLPAKFLCRLCEVSVPSLDALSRLPIDVLSKLTDMSAPTLDWLGSIADSVENVNGEALIRFAHIAKDSPDGLGQIKSVSDDTLQILLSLPIDIVNSLISLPTELLQELPAILGSVGDTLDEIPEDLARTIDDVPIELMQTLDDLPPGVIATLSEIDSESFASLAEIDPVVLDTISGLPPEVVKSLGDIPAGVLSTVLELPAEAIDVISKIDPKVLEKAASTQRSAPIVPRALYEKIGKLEDGTGKAWGRMVTKARSLSEIQMNDNASQEEFGSFGDAPESFASPAPESFEDDDTDAGEGAELEVSAATEAPAEDWSGEGLSAFGGNQESEGDSSAEGGLETADFSQAIDPEGVSGNDVSGDDGSDDDGSMQTMESDFDDASFDHMALEQEGSFDGSADDDSFSETVQSDEGWSAEGLSAFDQSSQSAESDDDDESFVETMESDDFASDDSDDDSYGATVQTDSMSLIPGETFAGDDSDDDDSFGETVQTDSMSLIPGETFADDSDDDSYGETVQSESMSLVPGDTFAGDDSDDDSYGETVQSESMSLVSGEDFSDDDDSYGQTIQSESMSLSSVDDDDDSYGQTMVSDDSFQTVSDDSFDDDSNAATMQSDDMGGMTADENSFGNDLKNSKLAPQQQKTMADAWGEDFEKGVRPGQTIKSDKPGTGVKGDSGQTLVISTRKLSTRKIPDYNKGRRPPEPREPEYELLKVLGEGGMGIVFNARQRSIDREVALKMLKPKTAKDKVQRDKFLAEAVVTGELDHPNIVPIYDVGASADDALFYSMKKVAGTPWLDVVKEKTCTENLEILMRSCDAVAFAHARGVIHRDLKPENIMLGGFGEVLVMDWGLAYSTEDFRKSASITESTSMGGTPAYMAPEMATGPISKIGEHSDVYLFGAILFEIVTSKPPHAGKNAMKCLMAAARNTIRPVVEEKAAVNDPTGELLEIAMKAMATEIPERTSTVKEFQAQIREYQKHTDSVKLSARAMADLKVAKKTDDYQDFSRALFGFQEAYAMWKNNDSAKEGIQETKLAYALSAERKGDFNQGMSLLDVTNDEQKEIFTRMKEANDEREARQARIQRMKKIAMIAAGVFLFTVSGAAFWINSERSKAVLAEKEAVEQRDKAEEQEKIAVAAKVEVEEQKEEVEKQKDEAEKARDAAILAQEEEAKAKLVAVMAKDEAVEAKNEAVKQKEKAEKAQQAEVVAKLAAVKSKDEAVKAKETAEKAQKAEEVAKLAAVKSKDEAIKAKDVAEKAQKAEEIAKTAAVKSKDKAVKAQKAEEVAKVAAIKAKETAEKAQKAEEIAKLAAVKSKDEAVKAQKAEEVAKVAAVKAKDEAVKAQEAEKTAKVAAVKARDEAVQAKVAEEIAKKKAVYQAYIARIGLADSKIRENAFDTAKTILDECPSELRDWEWGRLMHLCSQSIDSFNNKAPVDSIALSPDGAQFATGGWEGQATVWNRSSGKVVFALPHDGDYVHSVSWSPDGKWLATGSDDKKNGFIQLWDAKTGKRVARTFGNGAAAHSDAVLSVEFSSDGKQLVSASYDYSARIWNVADGRQVKKLSGHTYWVWDATFSKDGKSIATASGDGTAIVWDVETGSRRYPPFNGHEGPVYTVRFAPNGASVASGGYDRRVLIWKPSLIGRYDFKKLRSESGSVVPPGRFLALDEHQGAVRTLQYTKDGEFILSGSEDNSIKLWSTENGRIQKTFRGHDGAIRALALVDDDSVIVSASHDNRIKQWSIRQYEEIRVLQSRVLEGHTDSVLSAQFSPNGEKIVTASRDRTARIWQSVDGAHLRQLSEGHSFLASRVAYFPGGKRMATAAVDNTLRIWDINSATQKRVLDQTGRASAFAISADGTLIVTGGNNSIAQVWDAEKGDAPLFVLTGHKSEVTAVAISADNKWILTGDARGRAKMWDVKTRKVVYEMENHSRRITDALFLADGSRVLTASSDNSVAQWDTSTGEELGTLQLKHTDSVASIALRPVGRQLVTGSVDGTVRVWDIDKATVLGSFKLGSVNSVAISKDGQRAVAIDANDRKVAVWSLADSGDIKPQSVFEYDGELWAATMTPEGTGVLTVGGSEATIVDLKSQKSTASFSPHGVVASANFSSDGRFVVTGSWDSSARIWNATTGEVIRKLVDENGHKGSVLSASFSPDAESKFVLTAGDDGKVIIWDRATGKIVSAIDAHKNSRVNHAAFSHDGKTILTASSDKTAGLWDATTGKEIRKFVGHVWPVRSAAFSDKGEWIITASEDNTARVWDSSTGKTLFELKGHTGDVNAVAFAPNSKHRAVTASQDGTVKVWDLTESTADDSDKKAEETKEILTLDGHSREVTSVVFSPNGRYILTGSQDGKAILWLSQEWESDEKVVKSGEKVAETEVAKANESKTSK